MRRLRNAAASIARGGAIILCIAGIVSGTRLRSTAPRSAAPPVVALAGPFVSPPTGDPILEALTSARQTYASGDLHAARAWMRIATRDLDAALARREGRERWNLGNASQLLEYLHLYGLFAYGARPELDRQYEGLTRELERIEALNGAAVQPARVGNEAVSYDLISHLVRRIGDLPIGYDLITQQITSLGGVRISYDLITHQPTRIGDIEYRYDLIDRTVRSVAGVDID